MIPDFFLKRLESIKEKLIIDDNDHDNVVDDDNDENDDVEYREYLTIILLVQ